MAAFKSLDQEQYSFYRRLWGMWAVVLGAMLVLLVRFVYLQVIQYDHFRTLAESNRIAIVPITPNRGVIYDRQGVVLAHDYSAYTLELTPAKLAYSIDETITQLSEFIDIQPQHRKRFKRLLEETKSFESLILKTKLSEEEVARFAAQRYRFPGVEINARLFRTYPFQEVASHVIGYLGRMNAQDLEKVEAAGEAANYKGTRSIGKVGLELSYEKYLHGVTGVEEVEVDAAGRAMRSLSRKPPIAGENLRLTLDIRLQQVAELAFGEHRGALVAIEPSSGEILAMVSKPGYDPNLFVDGIDPQNWNLLNNSPDKPLLNRPLRGAYPPGSTYKPFMALYALTAGKRTAQQAIADPGSFSLPGSGYVFRDDKPGGHGMVDLRKSIVVSCDTYYYKLAAESDIDDIAGFMRQFGFGEKTGIDLEGELSGTLPSRAWKRDRFSGSKYREEHRKWYLGDNVSVGIGQGYNAYTPLQLAQAIAMVANQGVLYRPHLVKAIQHAETDEQRAIVPELVHKAAVTPEHLEVVRQALTDVTREGTSAKVFAGAGYTSAGKTGTAQVFSLKGTKYEAHRLDHRLRDHAWYIAYAPAENPKIALAVLVENGGFGAQAAAPIAKAVFDYYLLRQWSGAPILQSDAPLEGTSEVLGGADPAITPNLDEEPAHAH